MFDPFSMFTGGNLNAEGLMLLEEEERKAHDKTINLDKVTRMRNASLRHPEASLESIARYCGIKYSELTSAELKWLRDHAV